MCIITFPVSRRQREIYCGHARLCVCLSVAACLHYCTDPDVTWGSFVLLRGFAISAHGLRCYDNITQTRNVSEYMLVLVLCLVLFGVNVTLSTILYFLYAWHCACFYRPI